MRGWVGPSVQPHTARHKITRPLTTIGGPILARKQTTVPGGTGGKGADQEETSNPKVATVVARTFRMVKVVVEG